MKKLMKTAIMVTGLFLTVQSASYAAAPAALEGNDYKVATFCKNDAGDYCSKGDIKNDVFRFENGKFIVNSFDDGIFGLGDSGEFNEDRLSFTANYEVISENSLDKYTFDVKGMNLMDRIVFGQLTIAYYQLGLSGYDKQGGTKGFFFGKKK